MCVCVCVLCVPRCAVRAYVLSKTKSDRVSKSLDTRWEGYIDHIAASAPGMVEEGDLLAQMEIKIVCLRRRPKGLIGCAERM